MINLSPVKKQSCDFLVKGNIESYDYYLFEPYDTKIKQTEYNYFFCCCDFSEEIQLNQVYDISTTKKQIKESILSTQANSWNSILVLNFTSIFCWITGLFAVFYTSHLMFEEIPIFGILDLLGTIAISICAALTVYFLINTYMWIVHFEFKYLIANIAFFAFALGLGISIIYVFQQKGLNPDGFNGIPLHFDKNNTIISSPKF